MRLKSLELQGYKSFANKSTFHFDKGITTIVGPNGSGKSNVSDAIRWVLGEQSYTNLRGHRTSDMIFSGSSNRASLGMAYATIVLDNSDGSLPLDYNEVTISRRAFRSGENEYLINNNRVRLRDVTELLARGGLARQTYTAIGQGTIDRALSLRAEERRQLFEEAAGITYHRQKRAETLRRLQDTNHNLLRLNDIVQEIEPRLKRLERQVERFDEHQKIRTHLDGMLKVWYGYQWGQGQSRLHQGRVHDTINQERLKEQQRALTQLEAQIQTLRVEQNTIRGQLGDWHADSSKRHTQAEALQRELAVGEERARQFTAQQQEYTSQAEALADDLTQYQDQIKTIQTELAQTEARYRESQEALKIIETTLKTRQTEKQRLLDQQRVLEHELQGIERQLTESHSRLEQLTEREAILKSQEAEQGEAIQNLNQRIDILKDEAQQIQKEIETTSDDLETQKQTKIAEEENHRHLAEQAKKIAAEIAQFEKSLASLQARQDLLSRLRQDMSGYFDGVKSTLRAKNLSGIRGTVSQLFKVPAELEIAIEAALGSRLQDIIVNTWDDAEVAIEHLKTTKGGRATFLPLDRIRTASPLSSPDTQGVIGLAASLVNYPPDLTPVAEHLLNRILIVENIPAARLAFDVLKGSFQIVTRPGEIVRSGGAITGGENRNARQQGGILAREREWRELPKQISEIETKLQQLREQLDRNAGDQARSETRLAQIDTEITNLATTLTGHERNLVRIENSISDLKNQITWRTDLRVQAKQEIEANRLKTQEIKGRVETLDQDKIAKQEAQTALTTQLANFSTEAILAEQNQLQTTISVIENTRKNQRHLLQTVTQTANQIQSQLNQRQKQIQHLAQEYETLIESLEIQRQKHTKLVDEIKIYTDKIEPAEDELKELEEEQYQLEKTESQERGVLRRLEAEANRSTLELGRRQDEMEALRRQIEDDFGLVQFELSSDQIGQPALPIHPIVTQLPTIQSLPPGIEEDIRHLKVRLRQLSNVNPDAPREYEETQERLTFLLDQMGDLENAAEDLRAVIEELDNIMETAFVETFENVAKEFQNYFQILFNGGDAHLELTDPDDITETGVDIVARPPGKRLQSLELLSGGERSLTAQALIFALLKTSPTPYCVFDEVDAMLDEANVDRFREALQDLSTNIQFIVITHNRKTIEISSTIYGISMGEDAVSTVISRKLSDMPNGNMVLEP